MASRRDVISALEAAGWVRDRQKGSHVQFVHPDRPEGRVTVPHPKKDLKLVTLLSIQRQSGLTLR